MHRPTWVLAILVVCTGIGTARAQTPAFATMDRGDATSRLGFDVGVTLGDSGGANDDVTALRFDAYGHYVTPQGYGGYALIPLSYASFENDALDDTLALGNLELGGLYAVPLGRATAVLRGGFTLPTASDEVDGFFANAIAVRPRGTDAVTITPQSFWLRLSGSLLGRFDRLFLRGDLGFDVPLTEDFEIDVGGIVLQADLDPLLRFNVGGGIMAGPGAIMVELITLYNAGDNPDDTDPTTDDDDVESNIAITGRFLEASVHPALSLVFPLDDAAQDDIDFMFILGIEAPLPGAM